MKLTKQYTEIVGVTHVEGEEQCHDVLPRVAQLEAEVKSLRSQNQYLERVIQAKIIGAQHTALEEGD